MAGVRDAATIPKAGLSVISLLNADPALRPQGSLLLCKHGVRPWGIDEETGVSEKGSDWPKVTCSQPRAAERLDGIARRGMKRRDTKGAIKKEVGGRKTRDAAREIPTEPDRTEWVSGASFASWLSPSSVNAPAPLLCVPSGRRCQSKGPSLHQQRNGHVTQAQPIGFSPEILEQDRQV